MPPAMAHVLKKSVVPALHASAVAAKATGTMNQSTTLRYAMSIDVKCRETEVSTKGRNSHHRSKAPKMKATVMAMPSIPEVIPTNFSAASEGTA